MEGDKVLQAGLQRLAQDRVSGDPLPGPLTQAFAEGPIEAGGLSVRKVVASDWIILKGIGSPIIRLVEELRQNPKADPQINVTDEENFEIVYQFTHTAKECRALLKKGKEHFREAAVEFADEKELHPAKVTEIVQAAMLQLQRSWATALKYQSDKANKDTIDFNGTTPQTALGGGSNTLADSSPNMAGSPS